MERTLSFGYLESFVKRLFGGISRMVAAALLLTLVGPLWAAGLDDARRDAADKAIASLEAAISAQPEKFEGIARVAVMPVQGENGERMTELLTARVTKTSLGVMERQEIEKLLAEHKFAGDEYEDLFQARKETVARLGEFLGVDAYLMGRVVAAEAKEMGSETVNEVTLNIKMVNVKSAQIAWADDIKGSATAPSAEYERRMNEKLKADEAMRNKLLKYGIIAAIVLIVIISWRIASSKRPKTESRAAQSEKAHDLLKQDHALRLRLGTEVSRAQASLNQGRQKAHEGGRGPLADRMRHLDNRLGAVKRSIEQAVFGAGPSGTPDAGAIQRMADFERALEQDLKTLTSRCESIAHALVDDANSAVDKDLDRVEKDMVGFEQKFKERADFIRGLL